MKNTIHKCFVLVVILFSCLPVGGQSSYLFHHLQTSDGLSNSHINAILKDSYGFLWIGTESGLNRYDGYGFKVYSMRPNVPNTLLTNDIVGLSEDGLGNIWIDLGFCYMVYNRDKDCFISNIPNFLRRLSIVVDHNYKIYIDKNRDIWVLTNRKMFYLDTKRKALKEFRIKMGKASLSSIHISDDIENLYLIDGDGLLNQIAKKNGCLTPIVLPKTIRAEILNHSNVIYADSYNGLWLYSNKSELVYYRENMSPTWKKINLFSAINTQTNIVQSIFDDENGHVWIGTDHKGAFLYDRYKGTITNIHHDPSLYTTISSNNVDCIYRDNTGTMWLGHYKNGISCFNESFQYLVNIQFAECRDINAILEDKKGNIWFGTDGNGLFVKNAATNAIRQFQMPNWVIVTLLEDRQGRIWIGTYQNGLFCYENGRITQFTVKNSELSDNDVWDLQEDTYGKLWVAPLGGKVQRLNPDTKKFEALDSPNTEVDNPQNIYYAGGEILYVGTSYGLCVKNVISGKKTVCLGNSRGNQQFKQQFISAIYKDRRGILWLGHSQGMTAWDLKKDTLYYIDKESGLCDNIIRGIVEDSYGNLVVTTSNGLSILSVEKDKYGCFAFACRNFSVKDGLKDNYFNSHSICKLRNGIVLMGGTDGYTLINSNKIAEKNQPLAKIIFTGLKVGNKVIQVDSIYNGHKILEHSLEQISMLTFNYDDKLITLYFTTGDLLTADKVKYMYQLEGFSNQWLPTHDNKIEFSTLPPGTYRLLIKACNSDGIWNDNPTILTIRVKLPIYLSWWAIILYILIAGMLVLYSIRRTKRLNYNKLQQQKLQLEHEQAIYLNETKLKFFTNISHDLRTPLTLITTPIQILLDEITDEKLHKILRTMHKNAEQLMQQINSLLDFRKLDVGAETLHLKTGNLVPFIEEIYASFQIYATDQKISFTFEREVERLLVQFDRDKVKKIIINLLSNAFKYTPDGGSITVRIYQQNDNACVSIVDTGSGISDAEKKHVFERFYQAAQKQEKTGSGIGLHIVNEYVHMHGGIVSVADNQPKGSIFTFTLPVIEANISEEPVENMADENESVSFLDDTETVAKPVLLFVDDNKDLCDFMTDNYADEYIVLIAHNGQEALDLLNTNDVNVVVSDVIMPVMNGTELCKQIKTNILWSHIPVILLTARTTEESQMEGLELGADDYITKPFNFSILKLRIRKLVEWTKKCHVAFSQKMDVSPSEITITSLDQQLMEKAIRVVEENISDPEFSVEALGIAVGMSRSHLYKKLMHITGKGPAEFIRTVRLKRGRQLLKKSQLQIAEIAYSVGFNSPKIFTKNFRIEFGVSPSEYLRSLNQPTQTE